MINGPPIYVELRDLPPEAQIALDVYQEDFPRHDLSAHRIRKRVTFVTQHGKHFVLEHPSCAEYYDETGNHHHSECACLWYRPVQQEWSRGT